MDEVVGMVLAAGLGTRLRPLTEFVPKPAVPVAGLPLVQFALGRLRAAGARRVVVNAHHLAGVMEGVAEDAARAVGIALSISREPVIAGTGGALREARAHLAGAEAIVLWNGDILFDVDLPAILAAHRKSGALATMVLAPMPPGRELRHRGRGPRHGRPAHRRPRAREATRSSRSTSPASTCSRRRCSTTFRRIPSPAT